MLTDIKRRWIAYSPLFRHESLTHGNFIFYEVFAVSIREGNLEAPIRHPINWKDSDFYNEDLLNEELERVFDICHGCRRCVSLCQSFPTLFDLVDESPTFEVDGVDKADYKKVVDECFLCDLCYMTNVLMFLRMSGI